MDLIQTCTLIEFTPGRKALRCGWVSKANNSEQGDLYGLKKSDFETRAQPSSKS